MEYLSDDENKESQEELTFEEMYPDDGLDEETKNLVFSHVRSDDDFDGLTSDNKKKSKDKKKQKEKPVISLKDLGKLDSKNKLNTISKNKRCFNPRLPPFRTLKKVKDDTASQLKNTETNFPSLVKIKLNK